jgi:hypothetical protein
LIDAGHEADPGVSFLVPLILPLLGLLLSFLVEKLVDVVLIELELIRAVLRVEQKVLGLLAVPVPVG